MEQVPVDVFSDPEWDEEDYFYQEELEDADGVVYERWVPVPKDKEGKQYGISEFVSAHLRRSSLQPNVFQYLDARHHITLLHLMLLKFGLCHSTARRITSHHMPSRLNASHHVKS
eukprot:scaffold278595_cov34-Prasinocladus_malaysianus.AAC.1